MCSHTNMHACFADVSHTVCTPKWIQTCLRWGILVLQCSLWCLPCNWYLPSPHSLSHVTLCYVVTYTGSILGSWYAILFNKVRNSPKTIFNRGYVATAVSLLWNRPSEWRGFLLIFLFFVSFSWLIVRATTAALLSHRCVSPPTSGIIYLV